MKRLVARSATWLVLLPVALSGCGRAPDESTGSPSASTVATPSAPASPSSSPSQWLLYTDTEYHFSVSYPPGFTFLRGHGDSGASGLLMTYRAVDPIYVNTYPPGQIEIAIYTQDASTPPDWVTKHSAPATSTEKGRYWSPVTNEAAATLAGKAAVSFDWVPDTWSTSVHSTAVFLGTSYVLVLQWWAKDETYAPTLRADYTQMQSDLRL